MPDRVSGRHVCKQRLRRTDVGRCLVAADMLLAGLESQPISSAAMRVSRLADKPAGHQTGKPVGNGAICGVRTAIAHWHSEALHGADGNFRAELSRRLGEKEGE